MNQGIRNDQFPEVKSCHALTGAAVQQAVHWMIIGHLPERSIHPVKMEIQGSNAGCNEPHTAVHSAERHCPFFRNTHPSFGAQPQEGSKPGRGHKLPPLFTLLLGLFGWVAEDPADDTHGRENPQGGSRSW